VLAVQAAGFRHTGFTYFLKQAEHIWGWVSGNYPVPGPVNEPGSYAIIDQWEFYHNDRVTKVVPFMYEEIYHTDTLPPAAVTNLYVGRTTAPAGLVFSWTAPSGGAVSYQMKYFKGKPLSDYPDFDYAHFDTTKVPWWYAVNVNGEPTPSAAGTPDAFALPGSFPTDSVYYFALCSRDAAGNLSRLSNLVQVDASTPVSTEEDPAEAARFSLDPYPNPFNPAVVLIAYVPAKLKGNVIFRIYNAAGRLVKSFERAAANGKCFTLWPAMDDHGKSVASGVYVVRMTAGNRQIEKKIVLAR
jgi:hypothetical protein